MKQNLFALFLFFVCVAGRASEPVEMPELKTLFDHYGIEGSFLIYDLKENRYQVYNPERCNTAFCPASSFKIPNTLIALETGVVTLETIFPWNGEKMRLERWEQDLDISGAFRVSSVPVYQEIARRIGVDRMRHYLRLFHYGEMDVQAENLDDFWLEGESAITSFQQVYFLKQLYTGCLPVSDRVMEQTRRIMLYEQTDQYRLSGKTGAAVRSGKDIAWFVGWIETADNTWIFCYKYRKGGTPVHRKLSPDPD